MIAKRILGTLRRTSIQAIPTIIGILVINFLLLKMAPGDAADYIAADNAAATSETLKAIREQYGLDQPILQQFINYLYNIAHLNLGTSPRFNLPVFDVIMARLPTTFFLMVSALLISFVIGVTLGVVMAMYAGKWQDTTISIFGLILYSVPSFWIGLMLIVLFSVHWNVLPSGGFGRIGSDLQGLPWVLDRLRYSILPVAAMATFFIAIYSRVTRAAMLEVKSFDFVRTAYAKGLSSTAVTIRHVLRNALIPVTTLAGVHFGAIFGGAIVTETVFGIPGLGRLAFEAVLSRDFTLLLGLLFLSSILVIFANMAVDLIQAWLDPRIEAR